MRYTIEEDDFNFNTQNDMLPVETLQQYLWPTCKDYLNKQINE